MKPSRFGNAALLCCLLAIVITTGCDDKIERIIGEMSAKSVESEYRVVDDPLLAEWVDTVGHTLLGYTARQSIPYSFKVLETDLVNAFAAPYGHIYITTGLLDFADSEDEVWGVLGHEIGHVAHRHTMSAVKRGFLYNIGLAILGGQSETLAEFAGLGLGLLSLRYSRKDEYQADDMGRTLSFAAGYDPRGNAVFFTRLMAKYEKKRPSSIEVMFRTHPPSSRRIGRQRAMPELSDTNPDALLQTGRGYARRYQMRRAETMLAKAADLSPQDPTTLMALADVQLARGHYAEAQDSFETAARLRPNPYATDQIRLASAGATTPLAIASAQERASARSMLAEARDASNHAGIVADGARGRAQTIGATLAPTVTGTHSIINSLFGLADADIELSDALQETVTYANGAINRAIDPIYSAERQQEGLLELAQQMQATMAQIAAKLIAAGAGSVLVGEVAILKRTLRETRRALVDIESALSHLENAEPAVRAAQQSALQTTRLVDRLMRGNNEFGLPQQAQQSAQLTESRALQALAATRKSKAIADRAAIRTLVARMNTAAIGASPEMRANLDGLVAHYTLQRPRVVRELRGEGWGYGDAALLLAASKGARAEPTHLATPGPRASSIVDQVNAAGARTEGALVLLKYLSNALEHETEETG